jgi:transcriptional regulator with XRE-family HTH domain
MQMQAILDRISGRRAELGLSEAALSEKGGSRDLIRNWRRALDKGQVINARYDSLALIARALNVSEDWLIHGKGEVKAEDIPLPGMSEAATPFTLKPHATRLDDPQAALRAIFGPTAATPALFRVNADLPGFELAAGDVVLADLARLPSPGEIALASVVDDLTASAVTMVCRYLPPFLVAGSIGPQLQTMRVDDPGVTVRYPVVGSIRGIPPG